MDTVRLICVTRGHRAAASAIGFVEMIVWVFAISAVITHLDQWVNIVAFAGGYSTGIAVGMWIERKLALGWQVVTFMSRGSTHAVADRLRRADKTVTTLDGNGRSGPVSICVVIVLRRDVPDIVRLAREADPKVILTIKDVMESSGGNGPGLGPEDSSEPLPRRPVLTVD